MRALIIILLTIVWSAPTAAHGDSVGFRGDGTGVFKGTPPTRWSRVTGENIRWKTRLPSWANASPVTQGSRVFVTSEPTELIALDKTTGKIAWTRRHDFLDTLSGDERRQGERETARIPALKAELEKKQRSVNQLKRDVRRQRSKESAVQALEKAMAALDATRTTLETIKSTYHVTEAEVISHQYASGFVGYASATPIISDGRIYALFGNGVLGCHAMDGERLWMVHVDSPAAHMYGYHSGHAASPRIQDGVLIVGIGHVHAFDAKTGRRLWKTTEYKNFGTPVVTRAGDTSIVVTPMGRALQMSNGAAAAEEIAQLWYIGPLVQGDRLYFIGNAFSQSHARALTLLPGTSGRLTPKIHWDVELPKERYYGTPAPLDGLLHVTTRFGEVLALETATGAIRYRTSETLPKPVEVYSSPVIADGHLYMTSEDGLTFVYKPGESAYVRVTVNDLEPLRSSLFVDKSALYIRGLYHLYRIQAPSP